jgi:hypothetical protein
MTFVILKLFLGLVNLPLELELLKLGRELLHTRILQNFIDGVAFPPEPLPLGGGGRSCSPSSVFNIASPSD